METIRLIKNVIQYSLATSLLITSVSAIAQSSADKTTAEKQLRLDAANDRSVTENSLVASGGPADKEGSGFGGGTEFEPPNFELTNEDDSVIGTLSFGYTKASSSFVQGDDDNADIRASILRIGVSASAPFNGAGKDDAIDFKHLGDDGKATFSITWNSASYKQGGSFDRAVKKALGQCLREAIEPYVDGLEFKDRALSREDAMGLIAAYERANEIENMDISAADILDKLTTFSKFFPEANKKCGSGGEVGEFYLLQTYGRKALGDDAYKTISRQYINSGNMWFLGAQATAAYEKHDVLNRTTFVVNTIDHVGIDGTIYGGVIGGNGKWSGRISAGYARGYKAKNNAEICKPLVGGGQECISAEDGKPTRDVTKYIKGEGRFVLLRDSTGKGRLAIAPEVSYDIGEKNVIFDVPLYFSRTDGEGLSGGIRAGYNTDEKDFAVRLFVGIPFSTWFK